ncbi:MAG: vanadium-dependent haloperoxidase [Candidatus Eisenbacteria bacterium]
MTRRNWSTSSAVATLVLWVCALGAHSWAAYAGEDAGPATEESGGGDHEPGSEFVVEWNQTLLEVAEAEDGFLTLKGVRAAAMMHAAMHDAWNVSVARYETYRPHAGRVTVDPLAAANEAAFFVAIDQYPDAAPRFDQLRDRWRLASPVSEGAREGGAAAARAVLESRAGDGWDGEAEYTWHPMGPGVYAEFREHSGTPEGFIFGAGWAKARPFLLESPDQFRVPPPPAIDSEQYTRAYDEVKSVGAHRSPTRTPDQTHLAMWWKEFVESSHNRLARELTSRQQLPPAAALRMFALLNMSIFDAYVCVFDNKFHYNHWRPYTAIRWAEHDGNPRTEPDPSWTNLHDHTYAFPSYPSAHGCASAAAMTVLADTFGEPTSFTMRIPLVDRAGPMSGKIATDPPTRSFGSFHQAALECSMSRVYLGIHFRYDSEVGYELGSKVGSYAVGWYLRPVR